MPIKESREAQYESGLQDRIGAILTAAADDTRSGRPIDASSRVWIRETCMIAREQGIRAEELIIAVKRRWWHPDAETVTLRNTEGVLAQVVTLCIQEYYAAEGRATDSQTKSLPPT
ncbi:MAG: hypothetical protein JWM41_4804 [Gemmatimonadetes bacterium]|nr:hypothetical protein [Gemmatimonadota bacterium]